VDELTFYWLAGLLEGEGSFCKPLPSQPNSPLISIETTDEDIAQRVSQIFDTQYTQNRRSHQKEHWKPSFKSRISGVRALELMRMLRPLMGLRRQGQIDAALASYQGDQLHALTPERRAELKRRLSNGENVLQLANEFGVSKSYAYNLRNSQIRNAGVIQLAEYLPSKQKVTSSSLVTRYQETNISTLHNLPIVECFASGFNLTSIFDDSDLSKTTHWLAGLLEGEGSFKAPAPSAPNLISISLMMTDEDTIARVAHSFGVKYHQVKTRQPHHKTPYSVHLRGTNAYYLMRALYPLMSLRRQLQIDKALQHHQHNPHKYLTDDQAREVKQRIAAGQTNIQIATEMQIDYEIIRGIKRGRSYKYVMI
jgi:hypothetical protein